MCQNDRKAEVKLEKERVSQRFTDGQVAAHLLAAMFGGGGGTVVAVRLRIEMRGCEITVRTCVDAVAAEREQRSVGLFGGPGRSDVVRPDADKYGCQ